MAQVSIDARQSRLIVAQLKRSRVYRDYAQAFRETTGLPLALRPVENFDLSHAGDPKESAFCALMNSANESCAGCLRHQERIETEAQHEPKSLKCFAGLQDSSVPVRVGNTLIGFLQTGQILLDAPHAAEFSATARQLTEWGANVDLQKLEAAYFQTRVVKEKQYASILRLLTIFAQHLSAISNQLLLERTSELPPAIAKAQAIIAERYADELTLAEVARAVNMSTFYFCKNFKRGTGMTFTDYVARVRIEKVKTDLLDPRRRISEVAYAAGFQSLSQFNRVFRRIAGESPTVYRERLRSRP